MINLRYHIVSITAVFLALGIGVALGSTLIERATVDTLNDRLDEQSERLDRTDGENARLREEIALAAEQREQLTDQAVALYAGHLVDVPTVVLTVQGTDDELVDRTRRSLRAADADVTGVLRLTSRWESLSQEEVAQLATLLDRRLVRGPETRRAALEALAEELLVAAEPSPETVDDPIVDTEGGTDASTGVEGDAGSESADGATADEEAATDPTIGDPNADPEVDGPADADGEGGTGQEADPELPENGVILAGLMELGFVEFVADGSTTPLPANDARYVLVLDRSDEVDVAEVVMPLVAAMAEAGPAPLVVAETVPPVEEGEDAQFPPSPGEATAAIRADEDLAAAVATVDSIRDLIGQSAMVLALADLVGDQAVVGHYGIAEGATSMLPLLEE